jgi:hypothetical protein
MAPAQPRFPAPVNMYVRPSQITTSVVMRALAKAVPGCVPAPGSAAGGSLSSSGRHPASGRWYAQYEILNGGTGARPDRDGVSAMDELVINVMNTPVEALETEFPMRVEAYGLGARFRRRGKISRRPWRAPPLARAGCGGERQPAHRSLQVFLPGMFGAKPRSVAGAAQPGDAQERALTSKVAACASPRRSARLRVRRRRRLGRSAERDPERAPRTSCATTCRPRAAADDYGVVLTPTSTIDAARHAQLAPDKPLMTCVWDRRRRHLHRRDRLRRAAGRARRVRKYLSNPAEPARVMEHDHADLARDFGADACR